MDRQLFLLDTLLFASILDEPPGQSGGLSMGNHPADNITAVDIEDHIEMVIRPLGRTLQLGNIPRPDLVGAGGQHFRLLIMRPVDLPTPLVDFVMFGQNTIHGTNGTVIHTFIN